MIKAAITALCMTCAVPAAGTRVAGNAEVDVELVLAVDVSRSMDASEFAIQRAGYASALRHPDFIRAVKAGAHGRIALAYFEWSGAIQPESLVEWAIIDGAESADAFAAQVESRPDVGSRYGTSISNALDFGAGLFSLNAADGWRKVIDVSGDGPNNIGRKVTDARDAAVAQGIVVNGLPILISPSRSFLDLDRYYADCVIGGPGSFMLPVNDVSEFTDAIRRKLILEIGAEEPEAEAIPAAAEAPIDCSEGERDRRFRRGINVPPPG